MGNGVLYCRVAWLKYKLLINSVFFSTLKNLEFLIFFKIYISKYILKNFCESMLGFLFSLAIWFNGEYDAFDFP